jgi:ankyrin repeat protein
VVIAFVALCCVVLAQGFTFISAMQNQSPDQALLGCARAGDFQGAQQALERGANPNAESEFGMPALYIAASEAHTQVVSLLLNHKANANARNKLSQGAPLHEAAAEGYRDIAQLLVEHGAELDVQDGDEHTPVGYAIAEAYREEYRTNPHNIPFAERVKVIELLLDAGADITLENKREYDDVYSDLIRRAYQSCEPIARLALMYGAERDDTMIRLCTERQHGLIHAALTGNRDEAEKALATSNFETINQALAYAAGQRHADIVSLLLQHGTAPYKALRIVQALLKRKTLTPEHKECYSALKILLTKRADELKQIFQLLLHASGSRALTSWLSLLPQDLALELFKFLTQAS